MTLRTIPPPTGSGDEDLLKGDRRDLSVQACTLTTEP